MGIAAAKLVPGARAEDAASRPDEWYLRAREDARRLGEPVGVGQGRRGRASVQLGDMQVRLPGEDVDGDLDEDGTARRRLRTLPGEQAQVDWGKLLLEQSTWAAQANVQQIAAKRLQMITPNSKDIVLMTQ